MCFLGTKNDFLYLPRKWAFAGDAGSPFLEKTLSKKTDIFLFQILPFSLKKIY